MGGSAACREGPTAALDSWKLGSAGFPQALYSSRLLVDVAQDLPDQLGEGLRLRDINLLQGIEVATDVAEATYVVCPLCKRRGEIVLLRHDLERPWEVAVFQLCDCLC